MKRFFLLLVLLATIYSTKAATITWDGGGGDGLWATAANWVGDVAPTSTDDVILDNSVVLVTYIVTLPSGVTLVTLNTLTITPSGANNITLVLPSTNTAIPGLSIIGSGDAFVLNNGAVVRNSSGASSSPVLSIPNTFRINNGGHYIHNTSRAHAAIVSQLSTAPGTELGEFEFDDPSFGTTLSLNNRVYGSLTISAASSGTATYPSSASNPCLIRGNLIIKTGATLSLSFSANFTVQQDFIQAASSTFNIQTSTNNNVVNIAGDLSIGGIITETGSGLPTLELNGTANQSIIAGTISNSITFLMNNSAGATLNSPLILPYNLSLANGKIATTASNLLTMADNGTYTGGSATSFVEGPMKKIGDEDFVFPIGVGQVYAPVQLTGGTGGTTTDEFTAEYIRGVPANRLSVQWPPIDHVSFVEYWNVKRDAGAATKQVGLTVHRYSFAKDLDNTFVAQYDGSQWAALTSSTTAPVFCAGSTVYECGVATTNTAISTFNATNPFTLATDLTFDSNPLPVQLISFDAKIKSATSASITWQLAVCCSKLASFEVQKSVNGNSYNFITTQAGSETNTSYFFTDNKLEKGINYYRLKSIDYDGKITYSRVVAVMNQTNGLVVTTLYPNPVTYEMAVDISSNKIQKAAIVIYDINGSRVMAWEVKLSTGNNVVTKKLGHLPAGFYQLSICNEEGMRSANGFIKQ
jgi:trimeric autotransporter adhesin